jgi:hypothetical protein
MDKRFSYTGFSVLLRKDSENLPTPQPTLEKIHFLMYPEDKKEVLRLRKQNKSLSCCTKPEPVWSGA